MNDFGVLSVKQFLPFAIIISGSLILSLSMRVGSSAAIVDSQQVGTDAYARGDYVEVGQNSRGVFGASVPNLPAGYHTVNL